MVRVAAKELISINRKEELLKLVKEDDIPVVNKIIDNIVSLEERIDKVGKLPFIIIDKRKKSKQQVLPASKLYTSLLQQYNLAIKTFNTLIGGDTEDDSSPLRDYLKKMMRDE